MKSDKRKRKTKADEPIDLISNNNNNNNNSNGGGGEENCDEDGFLNAESYAYYQAYYAEDQPIAGYACGAGRSEGGILKLNIFFLSFSASATLVHEWHTNNPLWPLWDLFDTRNEQTHW